MSSKDLGCDPRVVYRCQFAEKSFVFFGPHGRVRISLTIFDFVHPICLEKQF